MADPINVVITGDQAQLNQQLALAKARLAEVNSALDDSAKKMIAVGTGASAQLKAKFADLAATALETRVEVANLSSALTESLSSTNDAAAGHGKLQLATAGSTREFIVLGHEILQGNFSRIPGSIMVLAERMGGLQAAIAAVTSPLGAMVVALGAAAAAAAYLTVEAVKASQALGQIAINAQMLGNSDATKSAITGIATEVAKLGNVSKSTTTQFVASASEMKNSTNPTIEDMTVVATLWAAATGKSTKEVSDAFKKIATEVPNGLEKVISSMGGATAEQIEQAKAIEQSGNRYQAVALILDVMTQAIDKNKNAIVDQRGTLDEDKNFWTSFLATIAGVDSGLGALNQSMSISDLVMKTTGQSIDQLIAKHRQLSAEIKNTPIQPQEAIANADASANKIDPKAAQQQQQEAYNSSVERGIEAINSEIVAMREQGASAAEIDKAIAKSDALNASLAVGQHTLTEMKFGNYVANVDDAVTKTKTSWDGAHSQMFQTAATMYRNAANQAGASAEEALALNKKADAADLQAKSATASEIIERNRAKIAQINSDEALSATQRIAATRAIYQAEVNDGSLSYDQRLNAERELSQETLRLHSTTVQQQLKTLQDVTQETVRGSNERVAAAQAEVAFTTRIWKAGSEQQIEAQHHLTEAIQEQVSGWTSDYEKGIKDQLSSTKLTEKQKLEIVQQALASIGAATAQNKALIDNLKSDEVQQEKRASAEKIAIARDEANQKIAIARSVQSNEIAQLDIDVALGRKSYQEKFAELTQYENKSYAVQRAALVQELQDQTAGTAGAIKSYNAILSADRSHQNQLVAINRQAIQQQIQEYTQLTQAIVGPVGNAITGLITKTMTLQQAVQSIFQSMVSFIIQKIEEWVTEWIVSLILGNSATATSAQGQIASNAAVAGSAGVASAAAIPVYGWAIAPEAGATDYAAAVAYSFGNAAVGLDVGAWNVPKDMPANIHAGEMVIPQTFAQGLRNGGTIGGGAGGGGGDTYNFNITATDAKSVKQLLMTHGNTLVKSMAAQKRNLNGALT